MTVVKFVVVAPLQPSSSALSTSGSVSLLLRYVKQLKKVGFVSGEVKTGSFSCV